jgi:putative ABC transport system permease protein
MSFKNVNHLPVLARFILRRMSIYNNRHSIIENFNETYQEIRNKEGALKANTWCWLSILKSLMEYIKMSLLWRFVMLNNYIKIALRNIRRHMGYSVINISGLVLGLSCFILVSLFVQYELSYDKYHKHYDRIYRIINHQPEKNYLNSDDFGWTQGPLAPTLMERYPEFESAARINMFHNQLVVHGGESFLLDDFYFADPEIFDIFSFELVHGDPKKALENPNSIILSETTAQKIFGSRNPLGKILKHENSSDLIVTGVLRDMPHNSHFRMESLMPFKKYLEIRPMNAERWNPGWYCYTYCLLKKGVEPGPLERKIIPLSEEIFKINRIESRLLLQPLERIHLYSNINGEIQANGNIKYVILFSSIAFLMLIVACINFMNLGAVRSVQRGREVAVRMVVGAQRSQLIRQFLGETIMQTAIAFILSLAVVWLVLPLFNVFFERDIPFSLLGSLKFFLILIALVLFTGIFSGSYPAFIVSSVKPFAALRGTLARGSRGFSLRPVLVVFQFAISMVLIICSLVVKNQVVYIQKKDVGYIKDRIVVIRLRDREIRDKIGTIKAEILKNPNVLAVSGSNYLPNSMTSFNRFPKPGHLDESLLTIYTAYVDYDFVDLYGLKLAQGRNFSKEFISDVREAVLVNETAAKALGWEKLNGQRLEHRHGYSPEIIGVLKDFNFQSLHNEISPLCFYLSSNAAYRLSVKIKGQNIPDTLKFIRSRIDAVSADYPFEYRFFDDIFNQTYRNERKLGSLFMVCSGLAVFIACLGLFGLVAFTAAQRTREIGVRKVLGASVPNIIQLLSNEFLKWVLLANILSWPAAYYAMSRWLRSFAYRVDVKVGVFVASALVTFIIALVTLSFQAIRAAAADPVDSLRYE